MGSEHEYEVILANKGDIEAIYTLSSPNKEFTFDPREGIVTPSKSHFSRLGIHKEIQMW